MEELIMRHASPRPTATSSSSSVASPTRRSKTSDCNHVTARVSADGARSCAVGDAHAGDAAAERLRVTSASSLLRLRILALVVLVVWETVSGMKWYRGLSGIRSYPAPPSPSSSSSSSSSSTTTTSTSTDKNATKGRRRSSCHHHVAVHILPPPRGPTQACQPMPQDATYDVDGSASSSSASSLPSSSSSLPAYFIKSAEHYHPDSYVYTNYTRLYGAAEDVKHPRTYQAAPCQLHEHPYYTHFPHAMQQLYQCFDFWTMAVRGAYYMDDDDDDDNRGSVRSNVGATINITPLLLYDGTSLPMKAAVDRGFLGGDNFVGGLIRDVLIPHLGLKVLSLQDYYGNSSGYYHPNQTIQSFRVYPQFGSSEFGGYLHRHPDQWHPLLSLSLSNLTNNTSNNNNNSWHHHYPFVTTNHNNCSNVSNIRSHDDNNNSHSTAHKKENDTIGQADAAAAANKSIYNTAPAVPITTAEAKLLRQEQDERLLLLLRMMPHPPRIAILNRGGARSLLNAQEVADRLSAMRVLVSASSSSLSQDQAVGSDYDDKSSDRQNDDDRSGFDFDVIVDGGHGSSPSCVVGGGHGHNGNGGNVATTAVLWDAAEEAPTNAAEAPTADAAAGSASGIVPVVDFERATFADQAAFFRTYDVVISGHGAQLTGLAFMGHEPCRQVMEVFPYNYRTPTFFGSLAVQAGVNHSYLYLHNDDDNKNNNNETMPWETLAGEQVGERVAARGVSLCPSTDAVTDAVAELIKDWYQCHLMRLSATRDDDGPAF